MADKKLLIFIPTYNESENVEEVCSQLVDLRLETDILFLDDNSPDDTGKTLDALKEKYPCIKVLHRSQKLGVGSAHLFGINWAYDHGYEKLVTMDADFTHSPEDVPELINNSAGYDLVVGSRYLNKSSLKGWNLMRKTLTKLGHFATCHILNVKYDATGAFRLYCLNRIPREAFRLVRSSGYAFFFESMFILNLNGFLIKEIPILLPARTQGHSKMNYREIFQSIKRLVQIYKTIVIDKKRYFINKVSDAKCSVKKTS